MACFIYALLLILIPFFCVHPLLWYFFRGLHHAAIENSATFIEFINRQSILPDELIQFDVVSRFTNIRADLATSIAIMKLE